MFGWVCVWVVGLCFCGVVGFYMGGWVMFKGGLGGFPRVVF